MQPHWIIAGIRRQWAFLVVFVISGSGVLFGALRPEHWLRGITIFASGFLLAAVFRLRLKTRGAGWLAIRSTSLDVGLYLVLGVLVFTFGVLVDR